MFSIWIVASLIFLGISFYDKDYFFFLPCLISFFTALFSFITPCVGWQILFFIFLLRLFSLYTRRHLKKLFKATLWSPNDLIGQKGIIKIGTSDALTGTVKIKHQLWEAKSIYDTPLVKGAKVQIVSREGLLLLVTPLSSQKKRNSRNCLANKI
jgi:membrane protein implicated in regulation of membrane protease activity